MVVLPRPGNSTRSSEQKRVVQDSSTMPLEFKKVHHHIQVQTGLHRNGLASPSRRSFTGDVDGKIIKHQATGVLRGAFHLQEKETQRYGTWQ